MRAPAILTALFFLSADAPWAWSEDVKDARDRGLRMARDIKHTIKGRYYDPGLRGVDLEGVFAKAEADIKVAPGRPQIIATLAAALTELRDSHTFLIPPMLSIEIDYGFETRMVGDRCFVVDVTEGSDAARKGLLRGDEIVTIVGVAPTRATHESIWYVLGVIQPRQQLHLVVRTGSAPPRNLAPDTWSQPRRKQIDIQEWFEEVQDRAKRKPQYAWQYWTYKDENVVVVKFYSFMVTDEMVNDLMDKINDSKAVVLDLRGNAGGSVEALQTLAGAFFKDEVELGSQKQRKSIKGLKSRRPKSKRLFGGQLAVLVDSESRSSAEVLARVIQLEGRGKVVGDRTAGGVMLAEHIFLNAGNDMSMVPYGLSVTVGELLMKDGTSLEGQGLTPDEVVLPTGDDLRKGRDPAMARAANLVGLGLSPEAAWSHFQPKPAASPSAKEK
jgi:C-terminal processing protease CtpA/Prc